MASMIISEVIQNSEGEDEDMEVSSDSNHIVKHCGWLNIVSIFFQTNEYNGIDFIQDLINWKVSMCSQYEGNLDCFVKMHVRKAS